MKKTLISYNFEVRRCGVAGPRWWPDIRLRRRNPGYQLGIVTFSYLKVLSVQKLLMLNQDLEVRSLGSRLAGVVDVL